jgi:hypothetical protein
MSAISILQDELLKGPLAEEIAPFIEKGNDGAILAILNRKDILVHGEVSSKSLMAWAAATGQRVVFEDTANDVTSPYRAIALTMMDLLVNGQTLNLADNSVVAMVNIWTQAGKATLAVQEALFRYAEQFICRTEQLSLSVTISDIAQALRG